ncbi:MAG: TolC family protein [Gemmatimonadaceae bacterium]
MHSIHPRSRPEASPSVSPARIRISLAAKLALLLSLAGAIPSRHAWAQASPLRAAGRAADLDSLIARALTVSPAVRAANARGEAARDRVNPAGVRPDPMLMAGVQNFPVSAPGFTDFMTMKMIGVSQTIPYPGKLSLRRQAAGHEVAALDAARTVVQRQVIRDVRHAYYDLAFLDRALDIADRSRKVVSGLIAVTEARYVSGRATQADVLNAQLTSARLAQTLASLGEERRATLARLNALLDRGSEEPVDAPTIPDPLARAAVSASPFEVGFVSSALGARAASSPLPSLPELQRLAVLESPALKQHEAMIAAQRSRVALAQRDYLPDVDVSLAYGQRNGRSDMITATVSLPLPLHRGQKQNELAKAAGAELAVLEAEHDASVRELGAEVARLVSDAERNRTQLALYVKVFLPQGRAALASVTESYGTGKIELSHVLEGQAALFSSETDYFRALSDFAKKVAELERVVGKEILP